MLYIVRASESDGVFEYEYGNLRHALEHYDNEYTATVVEYDNGEERVLVSKLRGKELTIQN